MRRLILCLVLLAMGRGGVIFAEDSPGDFFENKIRPILVEHCYDCHSKDEAAANLRLDTKFGWQRGGKSGPAIVVGDPSASLLFRAAAHSDSRLKMPPPSEGEKLSPKQLAQLAHWIRQGAFDPRDGREQLTSIESAAQKHWAFQALAEDQKIPAAVHPIDYLVDKQLARKGFIAAPAAAPRDLVRRATYDLTGLPPTQAQLDQGSHDFNALLAELLASPRYGERWARHWLDVARYSDAKDGVLMYGDARIRPFAYTYRDYVIRAFNQDKPFDQFIREQIAADQLGLPADADALAAMGLLTLGRMFDNNRHDVIDDQIDVISRGFLGLTVSCARCHDHKFDPIPTADYYSLYGVFASSEEPLERPRIENVGESGQAFEKELAAKLQQLRDTQDRHYRATLNAARERTARHLIAVATSEPDVAETSIFFLSLLPDQLRPKITYRWRQLIARRAFPDDPIFGPWADMMKEPLLRAKEWRAKGVDERIVSALEAAKPQNPEEIARVYGETLRGAWARLPEIQNRIKLLQHKIEATKNHSLSLADIVGGGDGSGTGTRGRGIHPASGKVSNGDASFIECENPDQLIAAAAHEFVDGVFVPKSKTATISSTGLKIQDLPPTSGKTWDYFKYGGSSGASDNRIDSIDYNRPPHDLLALHANKGITFDVAAMRREHGFGESRFQAVLANAGAQSMSKLDVAVYVDGVRKFHRPDIEAQSAGVRLDIEIDAQQRFLTIVVCEGKLGISHDQAILGDARIRFDPNRPLPPGKVAQLNDWKQEIVALKAELKRISEQPADALKELLESRESPTWFPRSQIYFYLSRKDKDAYLGLLNQLDAIAVKHPGAAARAMVLHDSESVYDPVVFQRGDPALRGAPVPRRFLKQLGGQKAGPFATGSGRLDLANAIADPRNPLTARVWVNRIWMHHFGEPLVHNPSDFGLRTERPLHAELLDFLAKELIRQQWRSKPLHKLIMTSKTYQRTSRLTKAKDARYEKQFQQDAENRWLWRGNRRRLDLEQMRDSLLFVSGKLDLTMYGRPLPIDSDKNRRRTIYAFVERQNLPNIVQTFDFANADTSVARRASTTVAQQALFAMNSPLVTNVAKNLAEASKSLPMDGVFNVKRVDMLYQRILGRRPTKSEQELAEQFLSDGDFPQLAQVLLMTNEFMFVD